MVVAGTFYLALIDADTRKVWGQVVLYAAGAASGLAVPPALNQLKNQIKKNSEEE